MRESWHGTWVGVIGLSLAGVAGAEGAGPLLEVAAPVVAVGEAVDVTVVGEPGHAYAVATSPTNRGLEVQGWPLQLGADAVVVATGQLDARGRALVTLEPAFGAEGKLYLQAVTAATAAFEGLVATPGKLVRTLTTTRGELRVAVPGETARVWPSPPGAGGVGQRLVTLAAPGPGRGEALGCEGCVGTDNLQDGSVTAAKLAPGAVGSAAWGLSGNGGTDPGSQFLGTTDGQPLEVRVNGARVLRLEPGGTDTVYGTGPNLLGGLGQNTVTAGVAGATVGGGGATVGNCGGVGMPCPNRVTDHFGTIAGGVGNRAGDDAGTVADRRFATVGGGAGNTASAEAATVSGGIANTASGFLATVSGGIANRASGIWATVGGGANNVASDFQATVGGGVSNVASDFQATVGGGNENTASGESSTVGGGANNVASDLQATVGGGNENTASGAFSTVPGGFGAVASLHGQLAYAAGAFGTVGDAQSSLYVLRRTTTNASPTELFLAGFTDRLTVAAGRALVFDALVVGQRTDGSVGGYVVQGLIKRVVNTTSLVGAPVVTTLGENVAAWNVAVQADDANDALAINVTGEAGQTIRWVAVVRSVEVAL